MPLFFTYTFDFIEKNDDFKYDLCCVGAFTLERYFLVKKIIEHNPELVFCVKLYLPKNLYITKFLTDKHFRNLDNSLITFNSLSQNELIALYRQTKAILDLPASKQAGLSMRTIESIGMRKKIVTSNPHVVEYPFYSSENIIVVQSEESMSIDKSWLNAPANYDENIRDELSIDSWAKKLLDK